MTIAPIARGVGGKVAPGSRYFPYYTRPWIAERLRAGRDPPSPRAAGRAVDSAIDQYNDAIVGLSSAPPGRHGRDWYLLDVAGLLDRLASRRYIIDPAARPQWWTPYELPPRWPRWRQSGLPVPAGERHGRTSGGLFSLDGVHPTTVAYGILAQEMINIMRRPASVPPQRHAADGPVRVDFELVRLDTLITSPPALLTTGLGVLGWADQALDAIKLALPFG